VHEAAASGQQLGDTVRFLEGSQGRLQGQEKAWSDNRVVYQQQLWCPRRSAGPGIVFSWNGSMSDQKQPILAGTR